MNLLIYALYYFRGKPQRKATNRRARLCVKNRPKIRISNVKRDFNDNLDKDNNDDADEDEDVLDSEFSSEEVFSRQSQAGRVNFGNNGQNSLLRVLYKMPSMLIEG